MGPVTRAASGTVVPGSELPPAPSGGPSVTSLGRGPFVLPNACAYTAS